VIAIGQRASVPRICVDEPGRASFHVAAMFAAGWLEMLPSFRAVSRAAAARPQRARAWTWASVTALGAILSSGCAPPRSPANPPSTAPRAAAPASPPIDPVLAARVDPVIEAVIRSEQIVGMMVVVARDGRVVYQRAAGFADREAQIEVSERTLFRLASMSQPVVSVATLALVDQHVIALDDPITHWLPAFTPSLADGQKPTISVRQLLTHTAGLDYPWGEPAGGPYHQLNVSSGFDQPGLSLEENLDRLVRAPLLSAPGSIWRYSLGTDVLGAALAKAGAGTLPEVVHRLVTEPLGIQLAFSVNDRSRLAYPYMSGAPRAVRMSDPQSMPFGADAIVYAPSRILDPDSYPSAGVGMVGTASDYLRFVEMLRTGGGVILSAQSAQAATSNQIGDLPMAFADGWGFGFGFAVLKEADPTSPWARGTWRWIGGYGSHFWVDPVAKLSVVVLTNTALGGAVGEFPDALRNAIYDFEPVSKLGSPPGAVPAQD